MHQTGPLYAEFVQLEHRSESRISAFGRRMAAWTVLIVAALVALKLLGAVVVGFVYSVLTVVALVAVAAAVLWALRRL